MYTLDGIPPVDPAGVYKLLTGTTVRGFAGRRANMLELPGVDGAIPDVGAPFMPGSINLQYRFFAATHGAMMAALERFNGVVGQRKLLTIVHDYGNGLTRTNQGFVTSPIVTEMPINRYVRYPVTLQLPNPLWRGSALLTADSGTLTATFANHTLVGYSSTAPITDALIRVRGGFSTAYVGCPVSGDEILINTPIGATEYAVIDTKTWSARKVTTDTWTGGTDISASVSSNKGRGHMLSLEPDQIGATGGRYRVRARATNPTSTPIVQVRAQLAYH